MDAQSDPVLLQLPITVTLCAGACCTTGACCELGVGRVVLLFAGRVVLLLVRICDIDNVSLHVSLFSPEP